MNTIICNSVSPQKTCCQVISLSQVALFSPVGTVMGSDENWQIFICFGLSYVVIMCLVDV